MNSPTVRGKRASGPKPNGSRPVMSSRRATSIAKQSEFEPRILQRKVVRQRRQGHFLARRDVANFVEDGPLQGHDRRPLEAVLACRRKQRVLTPQDRIIAPRLRIMARLNRSKKALRGRPEAAKPSRTVTTGRSAARGGRHCAHLHLQISGARPQERSSTCGASRSGSFLSNCDRMKSRRRAKELQ